MTDDELARRWDSLLAKAPRLRPWHDEMVRRQRRLLEERSASDVEQQLSAQRARWLRDFEALPQFAVSAIATTLQDSDADRAHASRDDETDAASPGSPPATSPEGAVAQLEALLADPAFALAFHCVEVRVVPALSTALPREIWFGLLHAGAPQSPLLTASTAVALVLRALGHPFAQLDASARKAALRLFFVDPADLRPGPALDAVLRALPAVWGLRAERVPPFVAAAAAARVALAEASALCARLVRSCADAARRKPVARLGGLGQLQETGAGPAAPEEIAELAHTSRRHPEVTGLRQLLGLL